MRPEAYSVPVLKMRHRPVDFVPSMRGCAEWAAWRVGLEPDDLRNKMTKRADVMLGRQLALWSMFSAHVPANLIAVAINASRPAVHLERKRIMERGKDQSRLFQEAAEYGRSMRPKCSI